jgi:glycosyltransferase involved in cell wall biosynthesis
VIIEAMGVGVPVVATSAGAIPELIRDGENGVLIPIEANGQLSESLMRLICAPQERQRLASEGRRTVQDYQCGAMVGQTERVLATCAN